MKNVLVIAYYFPPSGGAGVQRVLKHIRYLPDFGWNPIVLTVENGEYPARDESLIQQIPPNIHIERTRIYEPYSLYRQFVGQPAHTPIDVNTLKKNASERSFAENIAEQIRATFFIPDARVGWLLTAVDAGLRLIKEHNITALYNSSPPYTTALIARQLKRKTGLPWVTGFRDPWTGFLTTPKRWFLPAWIDKRLERSVFEEADAIECAWEGIRKDIAGKFPHIPAEKYHHIPNGFDSNDYPAIPPVQNERFTITYTGSMYGYRTPASFLKALEGVIAQGEILPNEVLVRFIGRFGDEIHVMFAAFPHQECLQILGYMPHEESIGYLLRSDALLLVVDEAKESEEIVPGKVYEYVGAMRPILAVAPTHGAIHELLQETASGKTAHQSDVAGIAANIRSYFRAWKAKEAFTPNTSIIQHFERKNATGALARLLAHTEH